MSANAFETGASTIRYESHRLIVDSTPVVIGKDLSESKLAGDEIERIDTQWLPFKEAKQLLTEDQVPTAQVLIALLKYELHLLK